MASAFIGKLKSKKGHEATIVRSKNIEDGTLRYSLYKHAKVSYSHVQKFSYNGLFSQLIKASYKRKSLTKGKILGKPSKSPNQILLKIG